MVSHYDAIPTNGNIAYLLWHRARMHGGRVAIVTRERETTYEALAGRAAAFAEALQSRGIEPGDRVAIFLERSADAAAAFFGTVATGAIAVMMTDTLRPRQVEYICTHSGAKLLLTSTELMERQPREVAAGLRRLDIADVACRGDFHPCSRVAGDVAQLIYTSGSTGFPKGVTIGHGNLWAGVQSVASYLELCESDRIASLLPFGFNYGFTQLLCALWCGGSLAIDRSPLPADIVAFLREARATVLPAVPPLWMQLLTSATFAEAIPSLRIMMNTGGRLPVEAVRQLRARQPQARLFLMYGLTEAFRATWLCPEEADTYPSSIGRAIPGGEIMILRDDGTPCGVGEVGELVQRGPTVALGYWNDSAATAAVFRPNPCRPTGAPDAERVLFSGDLAMRDEADRIFFLGRRDKLIKTLGHRVSPDEVVDTLYASGEVIEAVVTAEPDGMRGQRIVAVISLVPGGSVARLRAFCRAELPRHMQPARYQLAEELPRVPNGKYDYEAINAQLVATGT